MKINKPVDDVVDVQSIEVGVTHEIVIAGEKSWVAYRVVGTTKPGVSIEDARHKLTEHINAGVLRTVDETVKTVQERINS